MELTEPKTDAELVAHLPWTWRFRDPTFIAGWERWNKAMREWERAWWECETKNPGAARYQPIPELLPEQSRKGTPIRAIATEYLAARIAYLADHKARQDAQGTRE